MNKTLFTINLGLYDGYNPQAQPDNHTGASELSAEMKTFYDMTLLDEAQPNLVHEQFGQKRPIPQGGGKTIEFRKFNKLPKALTPLTEGVTPNGSKMQVTTITAEVDQFGDFIVQTDMLELTAIDNTIVEATKMLGRQAGLTLDTVVRDAICSGTNVSYASSWSGTTETTCSHRYDLTSANKLTCLEVKKAVRKLKSQNAPKINGDYVAIIHPDVTFDLQNDKEWIEAHKYARPENLYTGEIGKIAGVRFVETTEAKIIRPAYVDANGTGHTSFILKTALDSTGSTSVVIKENFKAHALKGLEIIVGTTKVKVTDNADGSDANGTTLTVDETVKSVTANTVIYTTDGGKDGGAVYCCLFLGADAYGVTEITGAGLETIVKQKGSAGTGDPLNQRSSVGWKALRTAEILLPQYIVRLEVGSTYSDSAEQN